MSRWPVLIHDAIGITVAWLGAYWFRFNLDSIPDIFLDQAVAMLPVVTNLVMTRIGGIAALVKP